MKIKIDTITTSPSGISLGCVIHGPEDAWIRFCIAEIPWNLITWELMNSIRMNIEELAQHEPADDPLF